jgi:hypothetical protein
MDLHDQQPATPSYAADQHNEGLVHEAFSTFLPSCASFSFSGIFLPSGKCFSNQASMPMAELEAYAYSFVHAVVWVSLKGCLWMQVSLLQCQIQSHVHRLRLVMHLPGHQMHHCRVQNSSSCYQTQQNSVALHMQCNFVRVSGRQTAENSDFDTASPASQLDVS